jgi:hypothetical protein
MTNFSLGWRWLVVAFTLSLLAFVSAQSDSPVLVNTWEKVGDGLEDAQVSSLAFDAQGNLYAGLQEYASASVFVLPSGSRTWRDFSDGLPNEGSVVLTRGQTSVMLCDTPKGTFSLTPASLRWSGQKEYRRLYREFGSAFAFIDGRNIRYENERGEGSASVRQGRFTDPFSGPEYNAINSLGQFQRKPTYFMPELFFDDRGFLYFHGLGRLYKSEETVATNDKSLVFKVIGGNAPLNSNLKNTVLANGTIYGAFVPDQGDKPTAKNSGVLKITPTKDAWVDVSANLPKASSFVLGASPKGEIYVGASGFGVYTLPAGVTTWLPLASSSLSGAALEIQAIAFDANGLPYIGTKAGVFRGVRSRTP